MQIAHARKVRDVAPLACKTDKVDARVLVQLCRRELVPELWVPALPGILPDVRGMDVLDLGCGTAYWSAWLARRAALIAGALFRPDV